MNESMELIFRKWETVKMKVNLLGKLVQNDTSITQAELDRWKHDVEATSRFLESAIAETYAAVTRNNPGLS